MKMEIEPDEAAIRELSAAGLFAQMKQQSNKISRQLVRR